MYIKNKSTDFCNRKSRLKSIQLTEHYIMSKSNNECNNVKDYRPDDKMIELISQKIGCKLPWSRLEIESLKNCQHESDFNKYLESILNFQTDILNIPKKCHYDTWTFSHLEDFSKESNMTSIMLSLVATEGQVST